MTTPNYANPVLGHSETLKEDKIESVNFYLKRMEWHTDWFAWTEYVVEMYLRDKKLVSIFKFGDMDTANQLFVLMVKGKKHDIM